MSCDFCKNIIPLSEFVEMSWMDRNSRLVKCRDGSIGYYIECDDYYYGGVQLCDIRFCPRCGRKLEEG